MLPSRLPSNNPKRPGGTPAALPIVPLAAASLLLMALSLCAVWFYDFLQPRPAAPAATVTRTPDNPFSALVDLRQRHAMAQTLATQEPRQVTMPISPALQTLGNPQGRTTLTMLLDPASSQSRQQLAEWLELSLPNVRVEIRYAPAGSSLAGGVVLQLAQRFGKLANLWQALQQQGNQDLDDTALLSLLAQEGVALDEIRNALADPNSPLLRNAQAAADWAEQQSLQPPVALIDGLVVDGAVLQPELLSTYLERRLAGRPLVDTDDYLLMRK